MSPSAILLPPLLAFDEACRLVLDHLKREVPPSAFWAVTRYEGDRQVGLCVRDDVYGHAPVTPSPGRRPSASSW